MGYLYEQALRLAMQPILDAGCITESAGGDIARVFRTLQKGRWLTHWLLKTISSLLNFSNKLKSFTDIISIIYHFWASVILSSWLHGFTLFSQVRIRHIRSRWRVTVQNSGILVQVLCPHRPSRMFSKRSCRMAAKVKQGVISRECNAYIWGLLYSILAWFCAE